MKKLFFLTFLILFYLSFSKFKRIPLNKKKTSFEKHYSKSTKTPSNKHFMANLKLKESELTQYTCEVKIGSSLDAFELIIDTSINYLWVFASVCSSCTSFGITNYFDCESSYNCQISLVDQTLYYGSGTFEGTFVEDTFQIGDYTSSIQDFITIESASNISSFQGDGILGLGLDSSPRRTALIENLKIYDQITNRIFSIYLGGKSDSYTSQFTLDGYDSRLIEQGSTLLYCPLIYLAWKITLSSLTVSGNNGNYSIFNNSLNTIYALIDSGTNFLAVDYKTFSNLYKYLNYYVHCEYIEGYIGCTNSSNETYPDIIVNLCGNNFVLSSEDYLEKYQNYYLVLVQFKNLDYFILGIVFMKKFYTVFDIDNNRIGFAPAVRGGPTIQWNWAWSNKIIYFWKVFIFIYFILSFLF